jgi:predicted nucleotidyltransferase
MKSISFEIRRPVPATWIELFRVLDAHFKQLGIAYMLTGGNARELWLANVFECSVRGRTTTDLDFGVAVASWDAFEQLKSALRASRSFEVSPTVSHRVYFVLTSPKIPLDFVPFGDIARPNETLAWPPDYATVMRVDGYEQAWSDAVRIRIADDLEIPIVSVPGLVLLKIAAWLDRVELKDAHDMFLIMSAYHQVLGVDGLHDSHSEIMERYGFDDKLAAVHVLALEVGALAGDALRRSISAMLTGDSRDKLQSAMTRSAFANFDDVESMLAAFASGWSTET